MLSGSSSNVLSNKSGSGMNSTMNTSVSSNSSGNYKIQGQTVSTMPARVQGFGTSNQINQDASINPLGAMKGDYKQKPQEKKGLVSRMLGTKK